MQWLQRMAGAASSVFMGLGYSYNPSVSGTTLAGIEIDADGGIEHFNQTGNLGDFGTWGSPLSTYTRADYDFRCDKVSGDDLDTGTGDAQDTWHAGSSLISFQLAQASGVKTFTGTLRMRPTGGGSDIGEARTLQIDIDTS
jgi:hypothetical protein